MHMRKGILPLVKANRGKVVLTFLVFVSSEIELCLEVVDYIYDNSGVLNRVIYVGEIFSARLMCDQ